jgi:hypothetical protein
MIKMPHRFYQLRFFWSPSGSCLNFCQILMDLYSFMWSRNIFLYFLSNSSNKYDFLPVAWSLPAACQYKYSKACCKERFYRWSL